MHIPTIRGLIRRRILANFRVDPDVMSSYLPKRFRPKLQSGKAIAGVCLIRLEHVRPYLLPEFLGISSENAAHRVAVHWNDDTGDSREGVFIPRRDTNSWTNHLLGGRLFPGEHQSADFEIDADPQRISFGMKSRDGLVSIRLKARVAQSLPVTSTFESLEAASAFFEAGSVGYSATSDPCRADGMVLKTKQWRVEPLAVDDIYSSFFANEMVFPKGSVEFDCALLMQNVESEWQSANDLYVR